jgi:hypothetical protein
VFRTYNETNKKNRTVSKQTKTTQNFLKSTKICSLSNCFGWSSVCFGIEAKQTKQTFKTNQNTLKKTLRFQKKIPKYDLYQTVLVAPLFFSVQSKHRISLFGHRSETSETKVFVSDSAKTRFGSSFGCSKDTLSITLILALL